MNNQNAQASINTCLTELETIKMLIESMGRLSNPVPFLTKYAIIKSCGTIEYCFKTIISDVHENQSQQVINYINSTFRNSSMNPSKDNICKSLSKFDTNWHQIFKSRLSEHHSNKKIEDSLNSLNTARNSFAHGGYPSASFDNVLEYFKDSVEVIKILDAIVK